LINGKCDEGFGLPDPYPRHSVIDSVINCDFMPAAASAFITIFGDVVVTVVVFVVVHRQGCICYSPAIQLVDAGNSNFRRSTE
jgi:hypothetical protein